MKDQKTLLANLAAKTFVLQVDRTELLRTDDGVAWHRAHYRETGSAGQVLKVQWHDFYVTEDGSAYYKDRVPTATIPVAVVAAEPAPDPTGDLIG